MVVIFLVDVDPFDEDALFLVGVFRGNIADAVIVVVEVVVACHVGLEVLSLLLYFLELCNE